MNAQTTAPVALAIATGQEVKVHAATCADLKKAPTKRAAYNGIHTQTFPAGTTERDVWIDYNEDFLYEGGADSAWPLVFLPCCATAGLVADADRTWNEEGEGEGTTLALITGAKADRTARNLLFVVGKAEGLTLTAMGAAAGVSRYAVADALTAHAA